MERASWPHPDDGEPNGGIEIEQEINAIRYELVVRLPTSRRKLWLVVRCYENGEAGMSIRYTAL